MLQVNLLGLVVVAGWAVLAAAVEVPTIPRLLGSSALPVPAFSEFWLSDDTSKPIVDRYTLYMSSFKPLAFAQTDSVWYTRSPGRYLDDVSAWKWELLDKTSYWPNNPDYLPREVLGFEGVVQTSGFLVPSKTRGKLQFYDMSAAVPNTTTINIASADPRDYSYHRVQFRDMDGDGDLDAITARFHNTNQEQNFLWMENPGQPVGGWTQHIMVQGGPDVHFVNVKLNSSGVPYDCYFGSELWQQRLSLHCVLESIPYAWTDPSNIRTISIDDTTGGCFDVVLSDLDQDGKLDVLLTSFNDSLRAGFVYVYQIPDDLFYGKWDRYTIGQDFIPTPGSNRMSPGKPEPYYPTVEYANEILPDGRYLFPLCLNREKPIVSTTNSSGSHW